MRIAFFGSSLVSAYWNGAATYYRGILSALHRRGHDIVFYEPDAWERQAHRDIPDPPYARSVVYPVADENAVLQLVGQAARGADLIVKASGVGVHDELLERAVVELRRSGAVTAFWDVDAAATLDRMHKDTGDAFRPLVPRYDLVFTYGGGDAVIQAYTTLNAKSCVPIYNALDPETHHPVAPDPRFRARLAFLGNRLPDREARVREFFFKPARANPKSDALLGGSGWNDTAAEHPNVKYLGHVYTADHNAFNSTPLAVLNICRQSMASTGFSPPTRVFEAAGAGACLITDDWEGVDYFLEPGVECLTAKNGDEVVGLLRDLTEERARAIGAAALKRVLAEHTYDRRAVEVENALKRLGAWDRSKSSF